MAHRLDVKWDSAGLESPFCRDFVLDLKNEHILHPVATSGAYTDSLARGTLRPAPLPSCSAVPEGRESQPVGALPWQSLDYTRA